MTAAAADAATDIYKLADLYRCGGKSYFVSAMISAICFHLFHFYMPYTVNLLIFKIKFIDITVFLGYNRYIRCESFSNTCIGHRYSRMYYS